MAPLTRLTEQVRRWFQTPVRVQLVCEIAADYVTAVRYQQGHIESWALRTLPKSVVRPAPLADNLTDTAAVRGALQQVVAEVGNGQRRCVLLVPDLVARVALLEFDEVPARANEADGLLRWRLKKDLSFDVEQAVLSYQVQPGRHAAHEVIAVVCLQGLIRQYEECLEGLGLHPGRVTLSTLATLNCLDLNGAEAKLLVKRDHDSLSLAIVHADSVRLFRSLPLSTPATGPSEEFLFEKIYPAVVYFQDQWEQTVSEVLLVGLEDVQEALLRQLEKETGCCVRQINVGAYGLPASGGRGAEPDCRLLPTVGWVRGQAE